MAREWTRVVTETYCGGCGATLVAAAPAQVIRLPHVTRLLLRGACCAGPAPPELPARVVRHSPIETRGFRQRLERLSTVAARNVPRRDRW